MSSLGNKQSARLIAFIKRGTDTSYNKPQEVAEILSETSENKASMPLRPMIVLGLLAGFYVAIGGILSVVVSTGAAPAIGSGPSRFLAGSVFSLGLILVILGGAELFTGNNLMVIGLFSKRISLRSMLYNWTVVYLSNFVGSLLIVLLIVGAGLLLLEDGKVGLLSAEIAKTKIELGFVKAFVRGIGANWLVCAAVWLAIGGKSNVDRILGIYFPIMAFVALSFEHSVANMFLIPLGLVAALEPSVISEIGSDNLTNLTVANFLVGNLLPVTLGNIVGGSVLVGGAYWYAFRHPTRPPGETKKREDISKAA